MMKKQRKFIFLVLTIAGSFLLFEAMDGSYRIEEIVAFLGSLFLLFLAFRRTKKESMLNSSMHRIDKMSGVKFEEYLMYQFQKKGYHVKLTPTTGDFGADLIMRKYRKHYIVQAKRYNGSVGIKAVQEVIGAKEYYGIEHGLVVTNSYYTKAARELAEASGIELWGRNELMKEFGIIK